MLYKYIVLSMYHDRAVTYTCNLREHLYVHTSCDNGPCPVQAARQSECSHEHSHGYVGMLGVSGTTAKYLVSWVHGSSGIAATMLTPS